MWAQPAAADPPGRIEAPAGKSPAIVALAGNRPLSVTPAANPPVIAAPASNSSAIEAKAGNHPGFGRLVLEFDGRVAYQQSHETDHLTLHFPKDVTVTPPAHPPHNVDAISAEPGLVDLAMPAGATTHVSWLGNRLVVDIFDPPGATTNEPPTGTTPTGVSPIGVIAALSAKALPTAASPGGPSPGTASPAGLASALSPGASPTEVSPSGNPPSATSPSPTPPARIVAALPLPLPPPPAPPPPSASPSTGAQMPASQVASPPRPNPKSNPASTAAASPVPSPPVPSPAAPPPIVQPPTVASPVAPSGLPETPGKQAASAPTQPAPSAPPAQSPPVTAAMPPSAQPATPPAAQPATPPAAGENARPGPVALAATRTAAPRRTSTILSLPFPPTVGVAAFRRGGSALVVFDERRPIDLAGVRDDPVFGAATIQLLPAATVLRLPLPANRNLAISQTQQSWRLAVVEAAPPTQPIPLRAEDGQLSLPADAVGEVVAIADPETGTTLLVGTQLAAGQAVPTLRRMPDFSLLPTWQGVVVAPLADRLELRVVNSGFLLTGGKPGLAMSASSAALQDQVDAAGMTRRLNLPNRPNATLARRLREQVVAAAMAPPLARGPLRQEAAETMIALGLGPEAQAMLQLAAADDPALGESADMVGLGAIAALLAGRIEDAGGIDDPRLTGSDEVALWRAVRTAETTPGSPLAAIGFAATGALIDVYPEALRRHLLPLAFETMIEGGQAVAAARLLAHQRDDDPTLTLARGMLRETNGDTDGALAVYDKLAAGRDRLLHARAAVRAVELRLSSGRIDATHAADALDRLLYAWRGDGRELALRERVADLREQTAAWRPALAMQRETEALFPEQKDALHARLKATFAHLLRDDALDKLAPLELVALMEENADLLPDGPAGEALEERLADRLVELDLPQRAGPVLAKLMASAPSPAGRAGFAARLAALRLRENDAKGALAALLATATAELPAPLVERRTLLEASARAASGDTGHAAAELAALGTTTADLARATILEQAKDWAGAEHALADYVAKVVPPTGELDLAQQRILVRYATAAAQAGDDATLGLLHAGDGARMPAGPFGDMFRLLTAEPVRVTGDLPRASRETAQVHDLPKALDALKPATATP